jgi:putative endonuclease
MKGYMYILKCNNGAYYTGSTHDLDLRLHQHKRGEGVNFTRKHLPVELVYYEVFDRIDDAFYREKQVQGWRRTKKEALINRQYDKLRELSKSYASTDSASSLPPGERVEPVPSAASMNSAPGLPPVERVELVPSASSGPGIPVAEFIEATTSTGSLAGPNLSMLENDGE